MTPIFGLLCFVYVFICIIVYFIQEKLIFHPEKLDKNYAFLFPVDYEELYIEMEDGCQLHALHFRALESKGIVFYVHGNAGSLQDWGGLSELYSRLGFDLFMFDYRGFGKSDGLIKSQKQFYSDVQSMYDFVKTLYPEDQITIEGFSIGTAIASKIALDNNPKQLIIKAPYYSLTTLVKSRHFYLPMTLLKYKFPTIDYLKQLKIPITVFHGTIDELIPIANAERIAKEVPNIEFISIEGCLHNDIPFTKPYQKKMEQLLNS